MASRWKEKSHFMQMSQSDSFFLFFLSLVGVNQKDCERQKERTTERDVRMKKGPSLERICFCCCNASVGSYKENCYSPSSSSFSFSTDGGDKRTRWGSERCWFDLVYSLCVYIQESLLLLLCGEERPVIRCGCSTPDALQSPFFFKKKRKIKTIEIRQELKKTLMVFTSGVAAGVGRKVVEVTNSVDEPSTPSIVTSFFFLFLLTYSTECSPWNDQRARRPLWIFILFCE